VNIAIPASLSAGRGTRRD